MTASKGSGDVVRTLIANEPSLPDDNPHAFGGLQRLCRAAVRVLPAWGVGVNVMSDGGEPTTVASSGAVSAEIQELQFTLGEGPCLDAFALRRPVLTPDLALEARSRWLDYAPAAGDRGVRAVFAFPLQMGAARLGVMDVYRDEVGPLSPESLTQAFSFADAAMDCLLDAAPGPGEDPGSGEDSGAPGLDDALESHYELYQAQGMVMIQLKVGLDEAMSRLRAYAYAYERRLGDVAGDIVSRRMTFETEES